MCAHYQGYGKEDNAARITVQLSVAVDARCNNRFSILYAYDDGDNDNDIPNIELSDNNVSRHIDISNNVDVCKLAMPSTNNYYLSQRDSKHLCDEVHNDLNCNTFWYNHRVVKYPGDGHCFIHSAANSLNVNSSMPTPFDDVSVILKQLSDEKVHNYNRYVDFIDGNGRGSLLQGLNEYINNRRYDTSFGDLVPIIVANALSVNLLIIENNGSQFEVQLIDCQ